MLFFAFWAFILLSETWGSNNDLETEGLGHPMGMEQRRARRSLVLLDLTELPRTGLQTPTSGFIYVREMKLGNISKFQFSEEKIKEKIEPFNYQKRKNFLKAKKTNPKLHKKKFPRI
jgi:hypothetical protein